MRPRILLAFLLALSTSAPAEQPAAPQNAGIIIYRPHRGMGAAFAMPIYVDNELVAVTTSGRYFSVTVPPGNHRVTMPKQKNVVTPVELDLAPGAEAFVRVRVEGCWGDCNLFLFREDAATASADLAKMSPSNPASINEHAEAFPYVPGAVAARKLTLGQPPPAPAPPPAPPAPKPATMVVLTQPGSADVYINDMLKGTTSVSEGRIVIPELAAGNYTVRVSLRDYQEWTGNVTLAAGETRDLTAKLTRKGPPAFTLADLEHMLHEGVASARLSVLVHERGVDFPLDDPAERRLRSAGADTDLLLAVAKSKR